MVTFPPLAPSVSWFSDFVISLTKGNDFQESVVRANSRLVSSKEFGRFVLEDSAGKEIKLSVAVEGGGRQLRSLDKVKDIRLSDHGDWRRIHVATIEACLGRKPFFRYFEESLCDIYQNRKLFTLEEFNSAVFQFLYTFLIGNLNLSEVDLSLNRIIFNRGYEIAEQLNPEVSSLEAISTYGKETLLGFLSMRKD